MEIKDVQRLIDNPLEPNGSEWAMDAEDILDEMSLLTPENQQIIKQIKFFNGQGVGKTYVDQLVAILKRVIKQISKDTQSVMSDKNECVEKSQSIYSATASNLQIDEDIRQISPDFYEIYNQCLVAKNDGLNHLYGMGFRKALEKLVTDFAINQHRDDAEKILNMSLHNRIEIYFKDSDAKTALMACKWLGNNEAHYENCNDEQDLQLFENLIKDILYYIHREIRHKQAEHINNTKGQK